MTQLPATLELEETKEQPSEQDIIKTLFSERDNYQQSNRDQRDTINEIYQAFIGEIYDEKDKSKSQEKIMKMRTEVNYIVPSIFSGNPELEVDVIGEEDSDIAYVAQKIINHRIETIPQAYEIIESWVKQAVVFGTSLIKVCWKIILKDNEDGTQTVEKDEPYLEVPNILDCFYNPILPDVECQNSMIFRSVLGVEQVKNNPAYDFKGIDGTLNREKVSSKGTSAINVYDSSNQVSSDSIDLNKASEGTVEVYERITNNRIQTVVDGKERLVLRDTAWNYGYINAVKLTHEPNAIPNRFDGFGVGHNTLGYSKLIQKLSNRLQDAVNLGANPHFLGRSGAGIKKADLVVRPGGLTLLDTGDRPLQESIIPLPVPDIKNGALNLLQRFDDEHRRASGANDLIQGASSNKTLGQDQIASTYSSNRFELINRRFKQALADVGRMILLMEIENIQSVDAPILKIFPAEAEVTEQGEIRYSRETVYQMLIAARERKDLKFNIKVKGETNVARNKDIQIKQLIDMYNLFGAILPPPNQMAWARKMLELRGIDEIDDLIPNEEAMQEQMGQQIDPMTGQPISPEMMQQGFPQQPQA